MIIIYELIIIIILMMAL